MAIYRTTHGLIGHRLLGGGTALLVTTTGRRTGRARTVALRYVDLGQGERVVVASNGGRARLPDWFLNVAAKPDVTVQIRSSRFDAMARVMTEAERALAWPALVAAHHAWAAYEANVTRRVPAVVLTATTTDASQVSESDNDR
ncbi:MAG: nitroreductase/quinone reductase family protein [Acidimicrobiales bacterium]